MKKSYYVNWSDEDHGIGNGLMRLLILKRSPWYAFLYRDSFIVHDFGVFNMAIINKEEKNTEIKRINEAEKQAIRYCNILNNMFI